MGLRNLNPARKIISNLGLGVSSFLAQLPDASHYVIAVCGAGKSNLLSFRRHKPHTMSRARLLDTAAWSTGSG
jgi:hypothetical protein